jgi:hypothetical protein
VFGAVRQILAAKPGWVLPYNPIIQFDFANGRAWKGVTGGGGAVVPPSSLLNVTRASAGLIDDLRGLWRSFPANTLCRSDKGMAAWTARTNLALWCRDLTNAAWAKVTMTTALTATGIDDVANSATTITATGALSTILQTVVQASTADTVSFFVKRRTGTGTIEVTGDGAVYTDITAALAAANSTTGGWYRAVVSATLVNPVLGLRITTSGDAVDVDFAQLEAGTSASSPILTTTTAVARSADGILSIGIPQLSLIGTWLVTATPTRPNGAATVTQRLVDTSAALASIRRLANTNLANGLIGVNTISGAAWAANVSGKVAYAWAPSDQALSFNGGAIVTGAAASQAGGVNNFVSMGCSASSGAQLDGTLVSATLWPLRLDNTVLIGMSSP